MLLIFINNVYQQGLLFFMQDKGADLTLGNVNYKVSQNTEWSVKGRLLGSNHEN